MSLKQLQARAQSKCELCGSADQPAAYEIPPDCRGTLDDCIWACVVCREGIEKPENMDHHHWRCLNESVWSQVPAVQIVAWRLLKGLVSEDWARDLLEMLYLDENTLARAQAGLPQTDSLEIKHLDSNGSLLQTGDTVTLIKDLKVRGANFTAKRGATVRGISLDPDNAEYIEGRVDGQQIVIVARFVKKSN